jgi:hypothetical protein
MVNDLGAETDYSQYNRELFKEKFEESFELSTDYHLIEEEVSAGSLNFQQLGVRLKSVFSISGGARLGQDYRKVIFKDGDYNTNLGSRFKFEDNVWIAINIDPYEKITKASVIKRCNNTINLLVDKETQEVHTEPVISEGGFSRSLIDYNSTITLPDGVISITAQSNAITRLLGIGKRVMFGKQVFKINSVENFSKLKTFDSTNSALVCFKAAIDPIRETDNKELEVADYYAYNEPIEEEYTPPVEEEEEEPITASGFQFSPQITSVREGSSETFSIDYYVDGVAQNHSFTAVGLNLEGYYSIEKIDNRTFKIECHNRSRVPLEVRFTDINNSLDTVLYVDLKGMY